MYDEASRHYSDCRGLVSVGALACMLTDGFAWLLGPQSVSLSQRSTSSPFRGPEECAAAHARACLLAYCQKLSEVSLTVHA